MSRLVVWGAGALGGRVARAWAAEGGEAVGYTRSEARHAALRSAGVTPRLGAPVPSLRAEDVLLLAVPGSAAQMECVSALSRGLAAGLPADRRPRRVVLVGSTAYYGLACGRITEETPPGAGARAAEAGALETLFRLWAGEAGVVLRVGGLYEPGRGPLSALQKRGQAPSGPPDKTLALIHYDDAADAALAALRHPTPRDTYLVVTPPCPTRQEFYLAACVLLDLPLPSFGAALGAAPASHDVARLRADLLPAPRHPRWQAALVPQ